MLIFIGVMKRFIHSGIVIVGSSTPAIGWINQAGSSLSAR